MTCAAIVGITEEDAGIMEEYEGSPALDAGLRAAAQAVRDPARQHAATLGGGARPRRHRGPAEATLEEEKVTDEASAGLAVSAVNQEAEATEPIGAKQPRQWRGGAPVEPRPCPSDT